MKLGQVPMTQIVHYIGLDVHKEPIGPQISTARASTPGQLLFTSRSGFTPAKAQLSETTVRVRLSW